MEDSLVVSSLVCASLLVMVVECSGLVETEEDVKPSVSDRIVDAVVLSVVTVDVELSRDAFSPSSSDISPTEVELSSLFSACVDVTGYDVITVVTVLVMVVVVLVTGDPIMI